MLFKDRPRFMRRASPFRDEHTPAAANPRPAVGPAWRLSQIAKRLRYLARYVQTAESAHAAHRVEVIARSAAMNDGIRHAREAMELRIEQTESFRGLLQHDSKHARDAIEAGLNGLDASLSRKLDQLGAVVEVLEGIGKELDLLAINAAIQAAGAGAAGRAFSVLATHIRGLARGTVDNARNAAKLLDFAEFEQQLASFRHASMDSLRQADTRTDALSEAIERSFTGIHQALESLGEHSRVITAMQNLNKSALEQQRLKTSWSERIARQLERIDADSSVVLDARLERLLVLEKIPVAQDYDRLADIRRRGKLRVAIEPAFKGLSFRMRPGEPLRGLDVDYIQAFAQYLGVDVEMVEHPWDQCCQLLHMGRTPEDSTVDVVWSALPPNAAWFGVCFSEAYTYLPYVLCRRKGDERIKGLASLAGKVLGCINDPAAFATLEAAGLRWSKHPVNETGTVRLSNLISYSDQSVIHDALADGVVDAFAVDQPIFAWACYGRDSPWKGRLEIIPGNVAPSIWHYAVGVADEPSSYQLLAMINRFLVAFGESPARQKIEKEWQFIVVTGCTGYRDEPGELRGEEELHADWLEQNAP